MALSQTANTGRCKLSIVVPTKGRPSLRNTIESIHEQIGVNDEVIIVADRHKEVSQAKRIFNSFRFIIGRWKFVVDYDGESMWGQPQKNLGISMATGTHISVMDDDDIYTPDAFKTMKKFASAMPTLFRMQYVETGIVLWNQAGLLECGNFGTPCLLMPNKKEEMPRFGIHYAGDADYIIEAGTKFGMYWRPEIIAMINPPNYPGHND